VRDWRDARDHRHPDILDDIQLILQRLRGAGIEQAVMVDLSPPDAEVVVLRAIVPGLETWIVDQGRLGQRAEAHWRSAGERAYV
jgi:ribosomal protein S12 methylthiotransferase accessory factor YcaO